MENEGPIRPEPKPVKLKRDATAVLVLDLGVWAQDPKVFASRLLPMAGEFLEKARGFGVSIIYTISLMYKGTPMDNVASALKRRETEPVIHPDAFDKFVGGELLNFLKPRRVKNLILLGAATNMAVLYTATSAARVHHYSVILPIDGVMARNKYEQEYALHQLSILPREVVTPIQFTRLPMIDFD